MLLESNCGIPAAGDQEAAGGVVRRPVNPGRDERILASVPRETVFPHVYQWPVIFCEIFVRVLLTGKGSGRISRFTEREGGADEASGTLVHKEIFWKLAEMLMGCRA